MPERYLGQPLGKYRVESLLGSGGFAWVFKGYDPELEIPVAIKVLKPQFAGDATLVERFRREAATAAKLRHPNIIKIYAVGREGDAVYFVMDYLPGGLADKLEATPSLPEDYVTRIGIDVARALGFAHREGVIHRDIKVDNILFDSHGNAVVADFGIARAVTGYTHQTGTNMVVGTPQYFAPEQARAKPLDGRADIYSLGVTLYRSATGRLPFEGEDWYEIARQHVEEPPPPPQSINPALTNDFNQLLLRCLAKAPDDRPATGEALAEELERILSYKRDPSSRTISMPATGAPTMITPISGRQQKMGRRMPRKILVPSAIALIGILAVASAVLYPRFAYLFGRGVSLDSGLVNDTLHGADTATVVFGPPGDSAGRDTGAARPDSGTRPVTPPGKNTPPVTPASQKTSLQLNVPTNAAVTINDLSVGTTNGRVRIDTLKPGDYTIVASIPSAIDGCSRWSIQRTTVTLRPGAPQPITLSPKACGTIAINAVARDRNERIVAGVIRYSIRSGEDEVVGGELRGSAPIVLPVGKYTVVVSQSACSDYREEITISADSPYVIRRAAMMC